MDVFSSYIRCNPSAAMVLSCIYNNQGQTAAYYRNLLVPKYMQESDYKTSLTHLTKVGAFLRGKRVKHGDKSAGIYSGQRIYYLSNGALNFIDTTTQNVADLYTQNIENTISVEQEV